MKKMRLRITEIAKGMAAGETESLRELREFVVDLDLTKIAPNVNTSLFTALYLSKMLTGDVWENLATDASFEFDEEKLTDFTMRFGNILQDTLAENTKNRSIVNRTGEILKWLYEYFANISQNPDLVHKGG